MKLYEVGFGDSKRRKRGKMSKKVWNNNFCIFVFKFVISLVMPYEKPKIEKIERKDYVFDEFHKANFKIEKFPELFERAVELANMPDSHFDDGVKMSKIVEILWHDLKEADEIEFTLEELKLSCLFHDIGKSGPPEADREQRFMVEQIFNPIYFNPRRSEFKKRNPKQIRIREALDIENFSNKEKIKKYLQTLTLHIYDEEKNMLREEKLDLDKHTLIDLWREHDYWTYQLLHKFGDDQISEDLIIVSSTHHTLEGHDPAMIDGDIPNEAITLELLDKYLILTLVDKYQAFIERSGKTHQETIKILEKIIADSRKKGIMKRLFGKNEERVYEEYIKYLEILAKHPELAEIVKKK